MSAPLLRARLIEHMQGSVKPTRHYRGAYAVAGDSRSIAEALREDHQHVVAALWALQKMGVVSFHEAKGRQGGLTRIRISDSIANENIPDHVKRALAIEALDSKVQPDVPGLNIGLLNDEVGRKMMGELDVAAVARGITVEHGAHIQKTLSPVSRDTQVSNVVRPFGGANRRSGFIDRTEPSAHGTTAEVVERIPPEDPFPMNTAIRASERRMVRHAGPVPTPEEMERYETIPADDMPVVLVGPRLEDYPAIAHLLSIADKHAAALQAIDLLIQAEMFTAAEEVEKSLPGRIDALGREVIALAKVLGWKP